MRARLVHTVEPAVQVDKGISVVEGKYVQGKGILVQKNKSAMDAQMPGPDRVCSRPSGKNKMPAFSLLGSH